MFVLAFIASCLAPTTYAQIPVTDGAHIGTSVMNQVETVMQWGDQLQSMAKQYQQLYAQYQKATQTLNALKGASNLGQIYDALPKNQLPADIQKAISDVRSLADFDLERARFPKFDGAPKLNKMYDVIAGQNASFKEMYKQTSARLENIKSLQARINSAGDPGDKLDLANRLHIEQATVQANLNAMQAYEKISKAEIEQAGRQAQEEWTCQQFENAGC
jgi:type IV secretion system protein VirB5